MTPREQGQIAEIQFTLDATKRGYSVATPWGNQKGWDLILDSGDGNLFRIQVKSVVRKYPPEGCHRVAIQGSPSSGGKRTHQPSRYDVLAVYLFDEDNWVFLRSGEVTQKAQIRIRTDARRGAWDIFDNVTLGNTPEESTEDKRVA